MKNTKNIVSMIDTIFFKKLYTEKKSLPTFFINFYIFRFKFCKIIESIEL